MAATFATLSVPLTMPDDLRVLFFSYPGPAWCIETISILAVVAIYLALLVHRKTPGYCTLAGAGLISLCLAVPMQWLQQYVRTLFIFSGRGIPVKAIHPHPLAGAIMALEVLIIICLLFRMIRRPKARPVEQGSKARKRPGQS